jgi:(R,R)-butanediol dehydrogenase/meso-butanediol dehydrogenase/diacetyl reductase
MAEYLVAPDYSFYKLPDSVSDEIGALTEPLAVGVHAVRRSKLQLGDTVTIVGAGTIGLSTLLATRAAGASKIYTLEISKVRGERALAMGATAVINPEEGDPVEQVRDLTGGLGVDISFDCVGLPTSGPLAVELARKAGTVVIVGMSWQPSPDFSFINIMLTEKTVLGSIGYQRDTPTVIELLASGRIEPSGLITGKIALKDAVEKGFKELINNPEKHLKILLRP